MAMRSLPPGFRFHPTDVELVGYYLKRKAKGKLFPVETISEIELYKFAPWELPEKSVLRSGDLQWYFFCPRDRKYPNGTRAKRTTDIGYWKSTGNDRPIIHNTCIIGMKKTLVFHLGKAPKGNKTDWVMYEYRLVNRQLVDAGYSQDAYVLCKIFQKSGPGPKIGEQYGAPFNEEEWEDETPGSFISLPHSSSAVSTFLDGPAVSSNPHQELPAASGIVDVFSSELSDDGFWLEELAECVKATPAEENAMSKVSDSEVLCQTVNQAPTSEPMGIYDGLEDLSSVFKNTSYSEGFYNQHDLFLMSSDEGGEEYLELNDFLHPGEKNLLKLNDLFGH